MTSRPFSAFPEIVLLKRKIFSDRRGAFSELFRLRAYRDCGIDAVFVQDNFSFSKRGVIRGMHFQKQPGQAKLITCLSGEIFDVFVDVRPCSPTFGKWGSWVLSGKGGEQLFIPVGFAHGFATLSDEASILYKVSSVYNAATEEEFHYNDPDVGIVWPVECPIVSERDQNAMRLTKVFGDERLDLRS